MKFTAKALGVHYSPYKLRPLADVVRGKSASYALAWFATNKNRRVVPMMKVLSSAVANAQHAQQIDADKLVISRICVDQGPINRYFKPGAQGRAMPQRRRLCHISVELEATKEASRGSKG